MPKKICILNNSKIIGGVEHHIVTLCQTIPNSQVEILLCCHVEIAEFYQNKLKDTEVKILSIPMGNFFNLKGTPRLINWLIDNKVDVLHTHLYTATRFAGLVSLFTGIKIIETVHIEERWRKGIKKLFRIPNRIIEMLFVDRFICVSKAVMNDCINNKSISEEKIRLIYNCSRIAGNHKPIRNIQKIGFMGRLEPQKRIDILIQSFATIHHLFPFVQLVIAGEGSLKNELTQLTHDLGIANKIMWKGNVEPTSFLKSIDLFVLPSDFEGFALVLLEASAFSLPVIATNISGNTEIIKEKVTGLLTPTGSSHDLSNKLKYAILNPKRCARMGSNLKEFVQQKFGQNQFVSNTIDIYQGL